MIFTGVDLVEVPRVKRMIEKYGDRFVQRVFTKSEIEYCKDKKRKYEHFAARFAAKEAVLKLVGTGLVKGTSWADVEIGRGKNGKPSVMTKGNVSKKIKTLGINQISISLSHTAGYAIAFAVGFSNRDG